MKIEDFKPGTLFRKKGSYSGIIKSVVHLKKHGCIVVNFFCFEDAKSRSVRVLQTEGLDKWELIPGVFNSLSLR
ncbi:hypothetical protein LEP1GSC047_2859 [Leptospira inadai serovar Lyme str. 10]|uniref:Uncharacterized protein n=2 Tax=Leptospira inadai serovar Lyme TaxID=293084 RepID=V6HC96_9LEPT|nr:hypothetical protein LEP1GSC047_2859 [Leptospira inadai serovar Lyme str. 10]PNV73635.1 hypothetical protein BES34_016395 [Leptospira inadai serovar Lyme]